jgi:hypothetical protein
MPKELMNDDCSELIRDYQDEILEFSVLDWQSLDD